MDTRRDTRESDTPARILAAIIGYRTDGMKWQRSTRLAVTAQLAGRDADSLMSTHELSEDEIISILNRIHPQWQVNEYIPTPPETDRQLRALCQYHNARLLKVYDHTPPADMEARRRRRARVKARKQDQKVEP